MYTPQNTDQNLGFQDASTLSLLAGTYGIGKSVLGKTDDVVRIISPKLDFGTEINNISEINSLWTPNIQKGFTTVENAYGHWLKHKEDFPWISNAKEYVEAARKFVENPPAGTLIKKQGGDTIFYDPKSNTFAAIDSFGTPRTIYKPNPQEHGFPTNLDFWNAKSEY